MSEESTIVSAFTEDQVTRLTGVSRRQLRYWAADSFFEPSIKADAIDIDGLRLYSFRDLLCLKIVNALRNDAKVPLQELRTVKERLGHLGDDMWTRTTLYVLGKKVVFDNPETGEKEEASSGQGVLQIPLRVVAGRMVDAVRAMRERKDGSIGKIEKKRGLAQNQAVIAGTRIPVRSIRAFAKAGYTIDEIIRQYPTLTKDDVEAAIDFKDVA